MLELAAKAVASTVDPVVALLVGALGAAALTVVAGFVGAAIAARREHARWVREQRMDAYRDFLQEAQRPPGDAGTERWSENLDELTMAFATVELVGPDHVSNSAREHFVTTLDYSKATGILLSELDDKVFDTEEKRAAELEKRAAGLRRETELLVKTRRDFVLAARQELAVRD